MFRTRTIVVLLHFLIFTQVAFSYFRLRAEQYASNFCNSINPFYCDASEFLAENENFLTQIMQYGGMGWCGVYIHGQNGETLDPVFGPENPIVSCNQCGSRQTLRIDTYPHDVFVNSERWWIVNDENDQPIYRISANDYDDINIPLELGQIVEIFFENEDTHYVWYFFTATNEGTDDDGNRLFDATMKAHLSISFNEWGPVCNRTVGEMWDAFGDESNWQYYFFTIWDGDGSGASNVEIHQATDQLNISVGDNK